MIGKWRSYTSWFPPSTRSMIPTWDRGDLPWLRYDMYTPLEEDTLDNPALFTAFTDTNNWKGKTESHIFKLALTNIVHTAASHKNSLLSINFYIMHQRIRWNCLYRGNSHLSLSIQIQAAHSVVFAGERDRDEWLNLSPSWWGSHCYLIPKTQRINKLCTLEVIE